MSASKTAAPTVAAAAARSLLRGQSFQALAHEVAWSAIRATACDAKEIGWLTPLVEAQLAQGFDVLPAIVLDTIEDAHADHLCGRPHDHDGAEVVARFRGRDAAAELLNRSYLDTLQYAIALLQQRRAQPARRWWHRRGRDTELVSCDVPSVVADQLVSGAGQYGWPRRSAA